MSALCSTIKFCFEFSKLCTERFAMIKTVSFVQQFCKRKNVFERPPTPTIFPSCVMNFNFHLHHKRHEFFCFQHFRNSFFFFSTANTWKIFVLLKLGSYHLIGSVQNIYFQGVYFKSNNPFNPMHSMERIGQNLYKLKSIPTCKMLG